MINFFCVRLLHCSNRALLNRMARLMFFHWLMILDRASFTKSQKSVSLLLNKSLTGFDCNHSLTMTYIDLDLPMYTLN